MEKLNRKPVLSLNEFNYTKNDIKNGYTGPGWYFVSFDWRLFGPFKTMLDAVTAFDNWKNNE